MSETASGPAGRASGSPLTEKLATSCVWRVC